MLTFVFNRIILKFVKKSNKFLIGATGFGMLLPLCRPFEYLSPHPHQIVAEKLANVQKRAYLCGVKMKINEQLTSSINN